MNYASLPLMIALAYSTLSAGILEASKQPVGAKGVPAHIPAAKTILADKDLRLAYLIGQKTATEDEIKEAILMGANVNVMNREGITPLMWAAFTGKIEIVKLLIEKGADVSASNDEDWSPLRTAASVGNIEICKLLIKSMLLRPITANRNPAECETTLKSASLTLNRLQILPKDLISVILCSTGELKKDLLNVLNKTKEGIVEEHYLTILKQKLLKIISNEENLKLTTAAMAKAQSEVPDNKPELKELLDPKTLEERLSDILGLNTKNGS